MMDKPESHLCSECAAGELTTPATVLVAHPNYQFGGLRTKKWVCAEHVDLLADDWGDDLRILRRIPGPEVGVDNGVPPVV